MGFRLVIEGRIPNGRSCMNRSLGEILRHSAFLFLGVLVAAFLVPGIEYQTTTDLLLAALTLAVLHALLKPLLILFTLPFIIFTLGLGVVLINAGLLYLASKVVSGFSITDLWPAIFGAIIVSLISGLATAIFAPKSMRVYLRGNWGARGGHRGNVAPPTRTPEKPKDPDVIDV